jgi:HSP20 family protein
MNVWTNEEGMVVTAELPGVNPDSIDISVTGAGDQLIVRGFRSTFEAPENSTYHRRERNSGEFTRTFQLPFAVDAGKVEATYKLGILIISLPRAEAEKPRKIAIKAA